MKIKWACHHPIKTKRARRQYKINFVNETSLCKGALPPKVDLRPNMPPIVGFGSGSCSSTADALCTAVEFFEMKMGKRWKPSRLFVQYNERLWPGPKEAQKYGVCSEFSWPFDPALAAVPPHVSCYLQRKAVQAQSIPSETLVIKTVLDAGMPQSCKCGRAVLVR